MPDTKPARPAAFIFIFITVLLDMLALGMVIPVLPKLIIDFLGGDTVHGARVLGVFGTTWALMQFVFSPLLGALSDRFGRRPIVLLSNFGLGLDYVLMAMAPTLPWLFVGRVISGITAASVSTAGAYIADVTPAETRAASFGMLGAAFGLGFVLGPALGGLLGDVNPHLPFWVAAGLSLANGFYGLFVLPESLAPERRSKFSWGRANPLGSVTLLRSTPALTSLSVVGFLAFLAHESLPSISVLYLGYRYGWTPKDVGLCLAAIGVCSALVQTLLVKPVVKRYGERLTLRIGYFCGALGFAVYGLAPTGFIYCLGIPLIALWGLGNPSIMGLMSAEVDPSRQGQLQGAISCLRGVSGMLGPALYTLTFASFIGEHRDWKVPGAPFLISSALLIGSVGFAYASTRQRAGVTRAGG